VFGEVGLLLECALASAAHVASLVIVYRGDVSHEAVLEGKRLGTHGARKGLLLLVDAHDVLVEVAALADSGRWIVTTCYAGMWG